MRYGGAAEDRESEDSFLRHLDAVRTPAFARATPSEARPDARLEEDLRALQRQLQMDDADDDEDDDVYDSGHGASRAGGAPLHRRRVSFAAGAHTGSGDAVLLLGGKPSAPHSARSLVSAGASTGASAAASGVSSGGSSSGGEEDRHPAVLSAAGAAEFAGRVLSLGVPGRGKRRGPGAGSGGDRSPSPPGRRGYGRGDSGADAERRLAVQAEEIRRLAGEAADLRARLASETRRARRHKAAAAKAAAARTHAEERLRGEAIERETAFVQERKRWEAELRDLTEQHERYAAALAQRGREEAERTRDHYERRLVAVERRAEEARQRHRRATRARDEQIADLGRRVEQLVSRIEAMGDAAPPPPPPQERERRRRSGAKRSTAARNGLEASAPPPPPADADIDLAGLLRNEMVRSGTLEERLRDLTERHSRLKTKIVAGQGRRQPRRRPAARSADAGASAAAFPSPPREVPRPRDGFGSPGEEDGLLLRTPPRAGPHGAKRHSAPPATAERPARKETERDAVLRETVESEARYVEQLGTLLERLGAHPLSTAVRPLAELHGGLLEAMRREEGPAAALCTYGPFLRLYIGYTDRFEEALELGARRGGDLAALLIAPVQRVARLVLLMSRLRECDPGDELAGRALEFVRSAASSVDEGRRRFEAASALFEAAESLGARDLVQPHRVLLARATGVAVNGGDGCDAALCNDVLVWSRGGAEVGRVEVSRTGPAPGGGALVFDRAGRAVSVAVEDPSEWLGHSFAAHE